MASRGRPPGQPKTGGRQPGTKNKKTVAFEQAVSAVGLTPLEFMLKLMVDEEQPLAFRASMAEKAAPYVHARKVQSDDSVTLKTDEGNALVEIASAVTEVLGRLKKRNEAPSE